MEPNFQSTDMYYASTETQESQNVLKFTVPNLINLRIEDAKEILKEKKIDFEIIGQTPKSKEKDFIIVETQTPGPNEIITLTEDTKIKLSVKFTKEKLNNLVSVPDVTSISLRKALNLLIANGFKVEVQGSGGVIDQMPKPGTEQLPGSKIILFCKNEM
jgi:beta-lactam-binding protein with PASTA domain